MEFLNKLEVSYGGKEKHNEIFGDSADYKYEDFGSRIFHHIECGDKIKISVQASASHYSEPRKTLDDLTQYKEMELAFIKDGLFRVADSVIEDEGLVKKIKPYFDGGIYAYVPVELIEEVYQHLK